ncbi:MAG: hypothetical protein JKY83_12565 [Rhizobiaceae bacterium]|nr:hypothetical protein [Rhizobiaceae bacterium]
MIKRALRAVFAGLIVLTLSACVATEEPLSLGESVQLLPAHALLHLEDKGKDEFYRLVYDKGMYLVSEKGSSNKPDPMALYKLPGLPKGYHIGWMLLGSGTSYEDNYYNTVWLEKSPTGRSQVVMFIPTDENKQAIAEAMNVSPREGPKIKSAEEMVAYSQTLFKLSNELKKGYLDIYDLSNKDDYAKAEALVGAGFLTGAEK